VQIGKGDLDVGYYGRPRRRIAFVPTLTERHIEDGKYQLAPLMSYDTGSSRLANGATR